MAVRIVVSIPFRGELIFPKGDFIKEFRLDFLRSDKIAGAITAIEKVKNSIITIRDRDEGGFFEGTFAEKLEFIAESKNSILDIEMKHFAKIPRGLFFQKRLILSTHNFNGAFSGEEIDKFFEISGGSMLKVAMVVKDIYSAVDIAKKYSGRIIFIDLSGNPLYRIILSFFSRTYLYTYYNEPTGPGQIDFKTGKLLLESMG